ncbi:MAG: hypothetical protein UY78_C0043G0002 [Parcubacteria group bacterium GW2011_GWA1_53_13]|nr:MAG: hypothetical protein UY78_C0043G0002 [Parcubacteria group bacterium GW2011_GWA1_53_13]
MLRQQQTKTDYIVVFEYTAASGPYAGVRTINYFDSKEQFAAAYTEEAKKTEKVVGEGVTEREAQVLLRWMSIGGLVRANLHEATNKQTGRVDERAMEMTVLTTAIALRELWKL